MKKEVASFALKDDEMCELQLLSIYQLGLSPEEDMTKAYKHYRKCWSCSPASIFKMICHSVIGWVIRTSNKGEPLSISEILHSCLSRITYSRTQMQLHEGFSLSIILFCRVK